MLGDLCAVLEPAARVGVEVGAAYASARGDPVAAARAQPLVAPNVAATDVRATRSGVCGANAQGVRRCKSGCRPRCDADVHIPEHVERQIGSDSFDGGDLVVLAVDPLPDDRYTAFLIMPATLSKASAEAAAMDAVAAVPQ